MNHNEQICCFCGKRRFYFNRQAGLPCDESIVFRDENVFVVPDIAPFVEGHYLIVTEKHFLSFRDVDLETWNSATKAKEYLVNSSVLEEKRVLILEHGTGSTGDGVCIDHAHTHVLPVPSDVDVNQIDEFISLYTNEKKLKVKNDFMGLCEHKKGAYIYYEIDGEAWVYPVTALSSQFSRQLLAHLLKKTEFRWGIMCESQECQNNFKKSMF